MFKRYLYNNIYLIIIYGYYYYIVELVIGVYYYRFLLLDLRRLGGAMKMLIKLIRSNLKTKTNIRTFIL